MWQIELNPGDDLQSMIEDTFRAGNRVIGINGNFILKNSFAAIHITKRLNGITIIGTDQGLKIDCSNCGHGFVVDPGIEAKFNNINITGATTCKKSHRIISPTDWNPNKSIYPFIDGAAILVLDKSHVELSNCCFSNNHSFMCGGAVSNMGGYVEINECSFEYNTANDTGSAVDCLVRGSVTKIIRSKFKDNKSNMFDGYGNFGQISCFAGTNTKMYQCEFYVSSSPDKKFTPAVDFVKNVAKLQIKSCIIYSDSSLKLKDVIVQPQRNFKRKIRCSRGQIKAMYEQLENGKLVFPGVPKGAGFNKKGLKDQKRIDISNVKIDKK